MDNLNRARGAAERVDYPAEMCGSHVKSMEIIGNIHDNPEILKEASRNDRSGENGAAGGAEADQENMYES